MMKSALMTGIALALVMAAPAEATQHECQEVVAQRLDRLDVDAADIRKINYIRIYQYSRAGEKLIGFEAWVGLHSCRGSLVVDMNRHCRVRQVYGRGECDLGGAVDTW